MEAVPNPIRKSRCDKIIDLVDAILNDTEVVGVIPFEDEWPPYTPPLSTTEAPNGWSDAKEYSEAHLPFEGFRG